jgi:hypothetical protein
MCLCELAWLYMYEYSMCADVRLRVCACAHVRVFKYVLRQTHADLPEIFLPSLRTRAVVGAQ